MQQRAYAIILCAAASCTLSACSTSNRNGTASVESLSVSSTPTTIDSAVVSNSPAPTTAEPQSGDETVVEGPTTIPLPEGARPSATMTPSTAEPGATVHVDATCAAADPATAHVKWSSSASGPQLGPDTWMTLEGDDVQALAVDRFTLDLKLAYWIGPGTWRLNVVCSDGRNPEPIELAVVESATAPLWDLWRPVDVVVALTGAKAQPGQNQIFIEDKSSLTVSATCPPEAPVGESRVILWAYTRDYETRRPTPFWAAEYGVTADNYDDPGGRHFSRVISVDQSSMPDVSDVFGYYQVAVLCTRTTPAFEPTVEPAVGVSDLDPWVLIPKWDL